MSAPLTARIVSTLLVGAMAITFGWLGGFAWREREMITRLWLEASEQRYLTMNGEVGPVTFLVTHDDAADFTTRALALDEVLGVEPYARTNVSAVAFANGEAAAIEVVRSMPGVRKLEKRFIPMICH